MNSGNRDGVRRRVLVVEDNPVNAKLVCDVLESEGYLVERARHAEEALTVLEQRIPDLILMDIGLPGMDGLTLTRKLKAEGRCAGVPIVALTAFVMKGDDRRAAEAGCDGYIAKPINTRRFPEQVAAFMDRPRLSREPAAIKVLVIEDDATDLKLVTRVLASSGLLVQHKVSADGAVDAILEDAPDVILLDMRLPGIDGRALARRLKADARTQAIPIVAVTAFPDSYSQQELRAVGCDLCIVKPIDTRGLPRQLEEVVQRRSDEASEKP
ncbi:MAG: response regulator [Deltaproteobacteria bacterium]|nr:response regulator [Deltaproteobacteria bacterium]